MEGKGREEGSVWPQVHRQVSGLERKGEGVGVGGHELGLFGYRYVDK